jgi:hypothetical protein
MVHIQKTINRQGKLDMAGYGKKKGGKTGGAKQVLGKYC